MVTQGTVSFYVANVYLDIALMLPSISALLYKAQSHYPLAANDFECAKILKLDDPNFSINYRKINAIAYIEIDNEPDTVEEFMPIFPSYGVGAS